MSNLTVQQISTFPGTLDNFTEVQNGNAPANLIHAGGVNYVQRALMNLEVQAQFSAIGPVKTAGDGPLLYCMEGSVRIRSNTGRRMYHFELEVPLADANRYFGGQPFVRANGLLVSCMGYKVVRGNRAYYRVQSAGDVLVESGRTCKVRCWKQSDEWKTGDHIDVSVMICKP